MTPRPGRRPATSGPSTIRSTATSSCRPGADCMRFHSTTPRAARANHDPLVRGHADPSRGGAPAAAHQAPQPLWFWWSGPTPPDLAEVWQAYVARFSIEHTFRFFKQTLSGRRPNCARPPPLTAGPGCCCWPTSTSAWRVTRSPTCACPGNHPCQPERRTPARVRAGLFARSSPHLGSPAERAKTLRTLARTPQRQAFSARSTLPGGQIDP